MKKQSGATSFQEIGYGTNPDRVFRELQEKAKYQYGNDIYAGHIGLKYGFDMATREVMTQSEALRYSQENMNRYSPRSNAGCVPIGEEKIVAEKEFSVDVKAKDRHEAVKLVKEKMMGGKKRAGTIVQVDIRILPQMTSPAGERKISTDPSNGEVYFSIRGEQYPTKREAVARLKEFLQTTSRVDPGEVIRIIKVQDQGGLSYAESSKLATFTVIGKRIQKKVGKVKGFVFFGWA